MAYQRYINAIPLSKGASLANVLGSLFDEMRGREQKKQDILSKEDERMAKLREQYYQSQQQPLEVFRPGGDRLSPKEQAEIEKTRAETSKLRAETAGKIWDRAGADKLAKAYGDIDFMKKQRDLERLKFDIEKLQLKDRLKEKGGINGLRSDVEEYEDFIKMYENLQDRLYKEAITLKNLAGDDYANSPDYTANQEKLRKITENLETLRKMHPVYGMFPTEEKQPEEKKPSWLSRQMKGAGRLACEAVEYFTQPQEEGVSPELPMRKEDIPPEPEKPATLSKAKMYYAANEWWKGKEKELDYLSWYVLNSPQDKRAMRRYQKLANDPEFDWYFK